MGLQSTPLSERYAFRSPTEPQNPPDGALWISDNGGQSGGNVERYYWDGGSGTWELESSVGPDTPLYPAAGALWRDTSAGTTKTYDGSAWEELSPSTTQITDPSPTVDGNIAPWSSYTTRSLASGNSHQIRPGAGLIQFRHQSSNSNDAATFRLRDIDQQIDLDPFYYGVDSSQTFNITWVVPPGRVELYVRNPDFNATLDYRYRTRTYNFQHTHQI